MATTAVGIARAARLWGRPTGLAARGRGAPWHRTARRLAGPGPPRRAPGRLVARLGRRGWPWPPSGHWWVAGLWALGAAAWLREALHAGMLAAALGALGGAAVAAAGAVELRAGDAIPKLRLGLGILLALLWVAALASALDGGG